RSSCRARREVGWLTPGLQMKTSTRFGSGGKGGFMNSVKRVLGGGQLFPTEYSAPAGGFVVFTARLPGVIRELQIDDADHVMVQSEAYICSTPDVEISVGLQKKLGAGIFGGAGLVFQKLSGNGSAWVQLSGEIVEYDLVAGQSMLIHPGHLALYRAEMALDSRRSRGSRTRCSATR
ncbi:MAG: AIM24 family protein, partial [Actinomycetota bacterium]|nr:AIM24 family protein [Actinomycetota bacterium]